MFDVKDTMARSIAGAHVRLYQATGGRLGGFVGGMPVLLLTTVGRRSGEDRVTPLTYLRFDDRLFLVASYGGDDRDPAWYLNLSENPQVRVQRAGTTETMTAATLAADERAEVWGRIVRRAPLYRWYQGRTDREIPVVELIGTDDPVQEERARTLDELTKSELAQIARDLEIPGRSRMTKAELLAALREREDEITGSLRSD